MNVALYVCFQAAVNLFKEINVKHFSCSIEKKGEGEGDEKGRGERERRKGEGKERKGKRKFTLLDHRQLRTLITSTYNDFENQEKILPYSEVSALFL